MVSNELSPVWKLRFFHLACGATAIGLGLASRKFGTILPSFIAKYTGDTLWALTALAAISVAFPTTSLCKRAAISLAFAYVIELSQLYHAPWLESLRHTTLGGLVLGFGFLWSDLACYTVGVASGLLLELLFFPRRFNRAQAAHSVSR